MTTTTMEMTKKTIFVFYTLGEKPAYFNIPNLPKGWYWVGSGYTTPIRKESHKRCTKKDKIPAYERETQYSGPKDTLQKAKSILDKAFSKQKKLKVIKKFKIRQSYLP